MKEFCVKPRSDEYSLVIASPYYIVKCLFSSFKPKHLARLVFYVERSSAHDIANNMKLKVIYDPTVRVKKIKLL